MKETALQFTIQLEAALRRKIEELSLSAPVNAKQIGRASCRERVCQYV